MKFCVASLHVLVAAVTFAAQEPTPSPDDVLLGAVLLRLSPEALSFMLDEAERGGVTDVADRLTKAGAVLPRPIQLAAADLGSTRRLLPEPGRGALPRRDPRGWWPGRVT